MRFFVLALRTVLNVGVAIARPPATVEDELGILNPQDTGREMLTRKIEMGVIDSVTCSLGINVAEEGNHELSRKLIQRRAECLISNAHA